MRWASLLWSLCACGRIGFDGVGGETGGDASIPGDGREPLPDMLVSSTCVDPGNGSTFPGGPPCFDWAANSSQVNAGIGESSGVLTITPNANAAGAQASCVKSAVPFGAGGAIVEVLQVINGLTAIQVGGGATALSMAVDNGMLLAQDASGTRGTIAFDATAMRYWRIRPGDAQLVFEYGDGTTWTQLATSTQAPQATNQIRVIAGTLTAVANPGMARFGSVNLCP